jgi:hypothetical protein
VIKDIIHHKDVSTQSVIHDTLNRLVGAEIVSSSGGVYKIQVITAESRETFDVVLRRVFRLVIDMFDSVVESMRRGDKMLHESVTVQHANIKRFVNYALRLLNKFGHDDAQKTTFYFTIINYLVKVSETVKNTAGVIVGYTGEGDRLKQGKVVCDLADEICDGLKMYYDAFYAYDVKKLTSLHEARDTFKTKLLKGYSKLSKDDVYVIASLAWIFDLLMDLSELRMAIEY